MTNSAEGKIIQIIGAVVDVEFPREHIPSIYEALQLADSDLVLDPCPTAMQLPPGRSPRQPLQFVPYNGVAEHPPWLRYPPARPRVCVTWGTLMFEVDREDLFLAPRVVDALAKAGFVTLEGIGDGDVSAASFPGLGVRTLVLGGSDSSITNATRVTWSTWVKRVTSRSDRCGIGEKNR